MRKLIALLFFCLALTSPARSQGTFTAKSCNQIDVNAVINGPTHTAINGDTINIPTGSCTWTTGIIVPAGIGITIIGNGTPNSSGGVQGASASCSNTAITISGATAFRITPNFGAPTTRLSCMALNYGSGGSIAFSILGHCTTGACTNLRVDNVTFNHWAGHALAGISYGLSTVGDMFGVIDHNTINGVANSYLQLVEFSHGHFLNPATSYGDNSWALPESYGSSNFLFIENNIFNTAGCCENEGSAGSLSEQGGGRVVVRFNMFQNMDNFNFSMGWHGTESNGRPRSTRAFEYYENSWSCASGSGCGSVAGARGGTGFFWGNDINLPGGAAVNGLFTLTTYRTQGNVVWGACDGSSPYDANDGVTYYTGSIASISGNTITVNGNPGWTTNQWSPFGAPYSIHDVTANSGTEIAANGSNTLTVLTGGGPGSYAPSVGHSIQILRATACIDQAGGRGAGILYNSTLNPANLAPAKQVLSPAYAWSNTYDKLPVFGLTQFMSNTNRIIRFRDYYAENLNQPAQTSPTSPFNGTTTAVCPGGLIGNTPCGIGHGTLANRPATCTPGVGYWATDEGNWNQSGSGGQGELFVCTATNAWTLSYTPYSYPHPLVTGGTTGTGAAPDPPTGLTITVK